MSSGKMSPTENRPLMVARGVGCWGWVRKAKGLRSTGAQLQNSPGDVKNSIGNTINNTVIIVWCQVGTGNIRGALLKVYDY